MVVVARSEIKRMRIVSMLTLILTVAVLFGVISNFSDKSEPIQAVLIALGLLALVAAPLAGIQLWLDRGPSKAVIFNSGDQMVIATNQLHQGFKLRLFRDLLSEHMVAFSDEERERWSVLTKEGFHPVFLMNNVRKTFLLPICFMVFDEVFMTDGSGRWDYYDCRNTSEPTFAERGIGPFSDDSIVPAPKSQPVT